MFGGVLHFRARDAGLTHDRIGKQLFDLADRLIGLALHEFARIEPIDVGEADQDLHGDRALIALHQVEIARRDVQLLGHAGLGHLAFASQPLQPRAGKDLARDRGLGNSHDELLTPVNSLTQLQFTLSGIYQTTRFCQAQGLRNRGFS